MDSESMNLFETKTWLFINQSFFYQSVYNFFVLLLRKQMFLTSLIYMIFFNSFLYCEVHKFLWMYI